MSIVLKWIRIMWRWQPLCLIHSFWLRLQRHRVIWVNHYPMHQGCPLHHSTSIIPWSRHRRWSEVCRRRVTRNPVRMDRRSSHQPWTIIILDVHLVSHRRWTTLPHCSRKWANWRWLPKVRPHQHFSFQGDGNLLSCSRKQSRASIAR